MHGRVECSISLLTGLVLIIIIIIIIGLPALPGHAAQRAPTAVASVSVPQSVPEKVRVRVGRWVIDRAPSGAASVSLHLSGVDLQLHALEAASVAFVGPLPPQPVSSEVDIEFRTPRVGSPRWRIVGGTGVELNQSGAGALRVEGTSLYLNGVPVDGPVVLSVSLATGRRPLDEAPESGWAVSAVAEVDIEDYIAGVLPSEMPLTWPLEALKAQAVAARSYLLAKMGERAGDTARFFDVEATVEDQRYESVHSMTLTRRQRQKLEAAVAGTRRLVLVRPGSSQVLSAHFHADCGGTTERASSVWIASAQAAPRPEVIAGCPIRNPRSWGRFISVDEIGAAFGRAVEGLDQVMVLARNESGRVDRLRMRRAGGGEHLVSGPQFRMRLGHDRIRSTRFEVKEVKKDGKLVGVQVTGVGAGHGVGLCQKGAAGLARMGRTHREILRHYYPSAELWEQRPLGVSPKRP